MCSGITHLPDLRASCWQGVRATVVGLGREGAALARFLALRGASVLVTDRQSEEALASRMAALQGLPIRYALGGHPDWAFDADIIFVSPGVPRDMPALVEASRQGIPLSSETELFFHQCPAPLIGITGSSGKTTTTALVGEILKAAGHVTWVGGNIGQPLLPYVEAIQATDYVVLELSSFQLEHLRVSPHIAAVLNITPNHLDRHKTMEEYIHAKRPIFAYQGKEDIAVFGYDDDVARRLAEEYTLSHAGGQCALFSAHVRVERGAYLAEERVVVARHGAHQEVCGTQEILLRGRHNVLNVLAACAVASEAGAPVAAMREAVTKFTGVEHRLELVRERLGVRYVNDSIATSPERSMAALRSYDEPIVLLAGGRDKHLPWDQWADLVLRKVRHLILFGEAAGLIERAVAEAFARMSQGTEPLLKPACVHRAGTLEEAVKLAAHLAQTGDVVLLSPGGTSFDAFTDFAQRGERFKALVREL